MRGLILGRICVGRTGSCLNGNVRPVRSCAGSSVGVAPLPRSRRPLDLGHWPRFHQFIAGGVARWRPACPERQNSTDRYSIHIETQSAIDPGEVKRYRLGAVLSPSRPHLRLEDTCNSLHQHLNTSIGAQVLAERHRRDSSTKCFILGHVSGRDLNMSTWPRVLEEGRCWVLSGARDPRDAQKIY